MKVIESIRYNRTGEVNEAVIFDEVNANQAAVLAMVAQTMANQGYETRRNLFTTVAIRIEF